MLVLVRVLRRLRALAAWTPARLALFAVVALVGCWPWLAHAAAFNDFRDAQVLFAYERDAVSTVRAYHQLPMWDPYYCGGISAFGTPQGRFVAPTFLLSLLFGAQRAQALTAFLLAIVGMEGFYRLAKSRTASALGPVIVSSGSSGSPVGTREASPSPRSRSRSSRDSAAPTPGRSPRCSGPSGCCLRARRRCARRFGAARCVRSDTSRRWRRSRRSSAPAWRRSGSGPSPRRCSPRPASWQARRPSSSRR
jgi:hypothetical protein